MDPEVKELLGSMKALTEGVVKLAEKKCEATCGPKDQVISAHDIASIGQSMAACIMASTQFRSHATNNGNPALNIGDVDLQLLNTATLKIIQAAETWASIAVKIDVPSDATVPRDDLH